MLFSAKTKEAAAEGAISLSQFDAATLFCVSVAAAVEIEAAPEAVEAVEVAAAAEEEEEEALPRASSLGF